MMEKVQKIMLQRMKLTRKAIAKDSRILIKKNKEAQRTKRICELIVYRHNLSF